MTSPLVINLITPPPSRTRSRLPQSSRLRQVGLESQCALDHDSDVTFVSQTNRFNRVPSVTACTSPPPPSDVKADADITVVSSRTGRDPLSQLPHFRSDCRQSHPCATCFCYVCDVPVTKCEEWPTHRRASHQSLNWRVERSVRLAALSKPGCTPSFGIHPNLDEHGDAWSDDEDYDRLVIRMRRRLRAHAVHGERGNRLSRTIARQLWADGL